MEESDGGELPGNECSEGVGSEGEGTLSEPKGVWSGWDLARCEK